MSQKPNSGRLLYTYIRDTLSCRQATQLYLAAGGALLEVACRLCTAECMRPQEACIHLQQDMHKSGSVM